MTKFEFDHSKLVINDLDLSGHLYNVDMSHDAGEKGVWGEYLAGLETHSITLDNSSGYFEADGPIFPPPQQSMRVQVDVPDGRWQKLKWRLKPYWPFRRLKVRYRTYSFTGMVQPWSDLSGATVHSQAPMSKGTETR